MEEKQLVMFFHKYGIVGVYYDDLSNALLILSTEGITSFSVVYEKGQDIWLIRKMY